MRKLVYNLEFPTWCPAITVAGYKFTRVEDYEKSVARLHHDISHSGEFNIRATTGEHVHTAYVEFPNKVEPAILDTSYDDDTSALQDILLLLSLFTLRHVFAVAKPAEDIGIIVADSRYYVWGGGLRCSIPYREQVIKPEPSEFIYGHPSMEPKPDEYNIGFEETLEQIYQLIREEDWQQKYAGGYFLFLARQAFSSRPIESAFVRCWTIWENLFATLNRNRFSDTQIRDIRGYEKIRFILVEYDLQGEKDHRSRKWIKKLSKVRNQLVHYGRFSEDDTINTDVKSREYAYLFVRLTEFIIAKVFGLTPSEVFDTTDTLEKYILEELST